MLDPLRLYHVSMQGATRGLQGTVVASAGPHVCGTVRCRLLVWERPRLRHRLTLCSRLQPGIAHGKACRATQLLVGGCLLPMPCQGPGKWLLETLLSRL